MLSRVLDRLRTAGWDRSPQELLDAIRPATWCLDWARASGLDLRFAGWLLRPDGGSVQFTVNGRPCDRSITDQARPDLVPLYSHLTAAEHAGFYCEARLEPDEAAGATPVAIQCADPASGQPLREEQAYFVPIGPDRWPMPDTARMKRVHGVDGESFRILGCTNARKIDGLLRRLTGTGIESRRSILDWGCGSGRLLRYLDTAPGAITGVDIDRDNVEWCRTHLPFARYETIPLHPPTAFSPASFDLLIGISIFTHLTETVQHEWLAELRRLATPDAMLMMTVHGPAVMAATGSARVWRRVLSHGFLDTSSQDLDDVLADKDYYRTTFHTHDYIRREWSRHFEILEIVPACIGNVQDLVVMRPKA